MTVASRLRRLEQQSRAKAGSPSVRVFWDIQLKPCQEHTDCDVEVETGAHHWGVAHLSFEGGQA